MGFWRKLFRKKDVGYVDLRSPEYKYLAEIIAAAQDETPAEVSQLLELLTTAYEWGGKNGWPLKSEYPQYEQIRAAGTKLDQEGGKPAMQRAFLHVEKHNRSLARLLSPFWHLVGEWQD
jgi:hypothetical protein